MKRILIVLFLSVTSFSFAQMTMKKLDGTDINNGDLFTFTSLTEPACYLGFKIYNNSSDPINIKGKIMNIINADGTNMQFCIGPICVDNIAIGNVYPANFPIEIEGNGQNSNFDHFLNYNPGINPNQVVDYVIKIYQVDGANNEIGNSVTFTYRYIGPLSNNSFESIKNVGFDMSATYIDNQIQYNALTAGTLEIVNLSGKTVLTAPVNEGQGIINFQDYATGIYVATFTNKDFQKASIKFVKK